MVTSEEIASLEAELRLRQLKLAERVLARLETFLDRPHDRMTPRDAALLIHLTSRLIEAKGKDGDVPVRAGADSDEYVKAVERAYGNPGKPE